MIEAAETAGLLREGGTIVEPTSGNTGVGLAMVAQAKGYHCIFVCPDKVSEDKRNVLKAYGADVVVCPTAVAPEHPDSYYNVSDRLSSQPGAWKPDQYSNPNNPRSHYETTGPAVAVPPGGAGWIALEPADGPPGQARLGRQHAVQGATEHGQAATAVRRGGRQLACRRSLPHASTLRRGPDRLGRWTT